ncbi:MAG: response regulator [Chloroflexota bacterium]
MIRVLVVDDHPVVREGLVALLEDEADFEVTGSVGSAEEALMLVGPLRADVILLDLELPGLDGVAAIPEFMNVSPGTRVLVFTAYDTDERVFGAIRSGAKGYLLMPGELSHRFRINITEVVLTRVGEPADHLVIESWHDGRGFQRRERR